MLLQCTSFDKRTFNNTIIPLIRLQPRNIYILKLLVNPGCNFYFIWFCWVVHKSWIIQVIVILKLGLIGCNEVLSLHNLLSSDSVVFYSIWFQQCTGPIYLFIHLVAIWHDLIEWECFNLFGHLIVLPNLVIVVYQCLSLCRLTFFCICQLQEIHFSIPMWSLIEG